MLKTIDDLNPTETEREIAAFQGWVAADFDRGAFLVRIPTQLSINDEPPHPWHLLFLPAASWPGCCTLAALQADTGRFYRRFIADGDLTKALAEAEKVLANWQG
jgi:hypothetical protein